MMSEIHQKCKQNYYMKRWYILILYIRKQVKSEVAPLLMEERCFIPRVAELSDNSGSNSEWLQKVGKKPSKRRRLGSLVRRRPKIDDTVQIQLMLSRNGKCKAGCRDPFRRNAGLKELIAFRQAWAQLHKLDQDQVVAWEVYLTHCFKCKSVSYFLLLAAGFSKHFVQLFSNTTCALCNSGFPTYQGNSCRCWEWRWPHSMALSGTQCVLEMLQDVAWAGRLCLHGAADLVDQVLWFLLLYIFVYRLPKWSFSGK